MCHLAPGSSCFSNKKVIYKLVEPSGVTINYPGELVFLLIAQRCPWYLNLFPSGLNWGSSSVVINPAPQVLRARTGPQPAASSVSRTLVLAGLLWSRPKRSSNMFRRACFTCTLVDLASSGMRCQEKTIRRISPLRPSSRKCWNICRFSGTSMEGAWRQTKSYYSGRQPIGRFSNFSLSQTGFLWSMRCLKHVGIRPNLVRAQCIMFCRVCRGSSYFLRFGFVID